MREILFRGKRKDNGEWVYGTPLYLTSEINENEKFALIVPLETKFGCGELDEFYGVLSETIGQFIGLTDKNGKKIFEGDIVAYNTLYIDGKEYQEIGYFECDEHFVSFRIHGKNMTPFDCEVIGNIYDNPELLKENNNAK